jgi:hypothetical protein
MDQPSVLDQINRLAERERDLRHAASTRSLSDDEHAELRDVEVHLDQCWDVLRRLRAKDEFGLPAEDVAARPEDIVEGYEQ